LEGRRGFDGGTIQDELEGLADDASTAVFLILDGGWAAPAVWEAVGTSCQWRPPRRPPQRSCCRNKAVAVSVSSVQGASDSRAAHLFAPRNADRLFAARKPFSSQKQAFSPFCRTNFSMATARPIALIAFCTAAMASLEGGTALLILSVNADADAHQVPALGLDGLLGLGLASCRSCCFWCCLWYAAAAAAASAYATRDPDAEPAKIQKSPESAFGGCHCPAAGPLLAAGTVTKERCPKGVLMANGSVGVRVARFKSSSSWLARKMF